MLLALLKIIGGLVALTYGADRFVEGAAALAARLGVSALLVGIVIVGFSTSAPEMLVAAIAAWEGSPSIAVGNALGSNITNIALVLGVTVLVCPLVVYSRILTREMPLMLASVVLASVLMGLGGLTRVDGIIFAVALVAAMGMSIRFALTAPPRDPYIEDVRDAEIPDLAVLPAIGLLLLGLALLLGGSRFLVDGSVFVARHFAVPELVIGLTIVAVGTSLPELAASLTSARRGHPEMALGNVLGSNMFNALGVMAMPAWLAPGMVDGAAMRRDVPAMLFLSVLLFVLVFTRAGQSQLGRPAGALLLACWVGYQVLLFLGVGDPAA